MVIKYIKEGGGGKFKQNLQRLIKHHGNNLPEKC